MLGVAILWITGSLQSITDSALTHTEWWQRPWIAGDAILFYLMKLAWPIPLAVDYGRLPSIALESYRGLFGLGLITLLIGLLLRIRKMNKFRR